MPQIKPNPFAITESRPATTVWRALAAIFIAAIFLVWVVPPMIRNWSIGQLADGIDHLPAIEQHARLDALSQLGEPGIAILVEKMLLAEMGLANAAFQVLVETQNNAPFRGTRDADLWQFQLMVAMERQTKDLDPQRISWIHHLASKTLSETMDSQSLHGKTAYATAVRLLVSGSTSPLAGQPILDPRSLDLQAIIQRSSANQPSTASALVAPAPLPAPSTGNKQSTSDRPLQFPPSVIPSSIIPDLTPPPRMQTTGESMSAMPSGQRDLPTLNIPSIASLEPYETRDLIDLLVGAPDELTKSARAELSRRGFSQADLAVATQLASPDVKTRLAVVSNLGASDVDPRFFLLWLSRDEDRTVRVAAINALATMNDPRIRQRLREMLNQEIDPAIANHLRVAIGLPAREASRGK